MKPLASIEKIMTMTMKMRLNSIQFSGFYVKFKNSYAIMTARHCVETYKKDKDKIVDVAFPDRVLKVTDVVLHPFRDLALIKIEPELPYQPLPYLMDDQKPALMQEVVLVGFPNGRFGDSVTGTKFLAPILRCGTISGRAGGTTVIVNASIYPGDSGGLVIGENDKGQPFVVGVITAF